MIFNNFSYLIFILILSMGNMTHEVLLTKTNIG